MATYKTEKYVKVMLTEQEKRSIGETVKLLKDILMNLDSVYCRDVEMLENQVHFTYDRLDSICSDLEYLGGKRPFKE